METEITTSMLLVVLQEHPPGNREGVWVICKAAWRAWLDGPGRWYHHAYNTALSTEGHITALQKYTWGKISLVASRVLPYTYAASNVSDKTSARHYEYRFVDQPGGVGMNRIYSVFKTIIEDDVCLELMPCVKISTVTSIDNMHSYGPTYIAFRVTVRGQSTMLSTKYLAAMASTVYSGARRISLRKAGLLWKFMCSYRFDILEYLDELGITI